MRAANVLPGVGILIGISLVLAAVFGSGVSKEQLGLVLLAFLFITASQWGKVKLEGAGLTIELERQVKAVAQAAADVAGQVESIAADVSAQKLELLNVTKGLGGQGMLSQAVLQSIQERLGRPEVDRTKLQAVQAKLQAVVVQHTRGQ